MYTSFILHNPFILFLDYAWLLLFWRSDKQADVINFFHLTRMSLMVSSALVWPTTEPANNCGNALWSIIVSSGKSMYVCVLRNQG